MTTTEIAENNVALQPLLGELISFMGDTIHSGEIKSVSKAALSQADVWTRCQDNIVNSSCCHCDNVKDMSVLRNMTETALPSVDAVSCPSAFIHADMDFTLIHNLTIQL